MFISVCKNVIQQNNKRGWVDPSPAVRVCKTPSGKATQRGHVVGIKDSEGNVVAKVVSSTDGNPVIKAGAKVVIVTEYDTEVLE